MTLLALLLVALMAFLQPESQALATPVSPGDSIHVFSNIFAGFFPNFNIDALPGVKQSFAYTKEKVRNLNEFQKLFDEWQLFPDFSKFLEQNTGHDKDKMILSHGIEKSIAILTQNFVPIAAEIASQIDPKTLEKIGSTVNKAVDAVLEKPAIQIDGKANCDTLKKPTDFLEASAEKVITVANQLIEYSQKYPIPVYPAMKAMKYSINAAIEKIDSFKSSKEVSACREYVIRLDKVLETLREVEVKL